MPTIVVIDDSVSVRRAVELALRPRDFEVHPAASVAEAKEVMAKVRPDLVVCDVLLGDGKGFEAVTWLHKQKGSESVPVIMVSGLVNDQVQSWATEAGAAVVLTKPFRADELLAQVDALMPPAAAKKAPPATATPAAKKSSPAQPVSKRPRAAAPSSSGSSAPARALRKRHPPAPRTAPQERGPDFRGVAAVRGVTFAALVDAEGLVLKAAGDSKRGVEASGALAAMALADVARLGEATSLGGLRTMLFEFEKGFVMCATLSGGRIAIALIDGHAALGMVRFEFKKLLAADR